MDNTVQQAVIRKEAAMCCWVHLGWEVIYVLDKEEWS